MRRNEIASAEEQLGLNSTKNVSILFIKIIKIR